MIDSVELAGFAFVSDFDRADILRNDTEALDELWPHAQVILINADGKVATDDEGKLCWWSGCNLGERPADAILLGQIEDISWFAISGSVLNLEVCGWSDLRQSAMLWSGLEANLFATAKAMVHWQLNTQFCGACGSDIVFQNAGYIGKCHSCGREHYPRINPAVIMAVSDGNRLLLGRHASWPARQYSVIAGFVEPGETLEHAVAREVYEEAHVRVNSCHYMGSQPWPFPSALMLGFMAEASPDTPQNSEELEDVRWFSTEAIGLAIADTNSGNLDAEVLLSPAISISRALIEHWYEQQTSSR